MDERIIKIVRAMAQADLTYNDNNGSMECLFCNGSGGHGIHWDVVKHDDDCPIILACEVLGDMEEEPATK